MLRTAMQKIVRGEVVVEEDSFPKFMDQRGFNNRWRTSDDFHEFLARNDQSLGKLLNSEAFASLAEGAVGPYDFPMMLGILLSGLAIAQVVIARRTQTPAMTDQKIGETSTTPENISSSINVLFGLGMVLLYILLAETVGFLILTAGLLVLFLWRLGTKLTSAAAISIILVPLVYYLFAVILRVPLPRGWWGV